MRCISRQKKQREKTERGKKRVDSDRVLYQNRELSWLKFNRRVLEQADDETVPLFEQLKFIAIFANNLDEFYMIRVGSLYDQSIFDPMAIDNKSGMTPLQQLVAIFQQTYRELERKDALYAAVMQKLSRCGITQVFPQDLTQTDSVFLEAYFNQEILPIISPQVIDKHHPFPFLKNKGMYVGVHLASKNNSLKFGVVPASDSLSRLVFLPGTDIRFMLVEDIIFHFADRIFDQYRVVDKTIFRITRNADINVEEALNEEDIDFRDAMQQVLKTRRKLAAVRLELFSSINIEWMKYLSQKLDLGENQVFITKTPLDLTFVSLLERSVRKRGHGALFYSPLIPQDSPQVLSGVPIMEQLRQRDLLLSYPFESMKPFLRLLQEAADDPDVVSIKITLYRVANHSKVVESLIAAAENGKSVTAVVELRARFDEENNIGWSRRLEEAGCNIIYGLTGYKVHSKLLLITRKKSGKMVEYYTQIGTGNYNENTAKLYTDLCLMTANREIGADAAEIFKNISVGSLPREPLHLVCSPVNLKKKMMALLDEEIEYARHGMQGLFFGKFNSLTDKELIDKLIEASQNGVRVQLIIRGICCLRPDVPGYTDNISVVSIVGRFLEHSRIFLFGTGDRRKIYISSADFMTRNTERRVEVAAPVYDPAIKERLVGLMQQLLSDNVKLRKLLSNGEYVLQYQEGDERVDAQIALYEQAYQNGRQAGSQNLKKEKKSTFREWLEKKLPHRRG